MIPLNRIAQIKDGENAEDRQRDDLLTNFELRGGIDIAAPAVGRDLQEILEEGDAPTRHNDQPDGTVLEFQVAIPREGHKNVGERQQYKRKPARLGQIHNKYITTAPGCGGRR